MQFKDNASATYSKKKWRKFLFFLLCSGVSFWGSISAQSPYYHFNGKKIPLSVSKEKICILTPKVHESTSQKLQNAVFESEISNDDFIIHVVDMKDTSAYYASYYGNADAGRKEKSDLRNAIALPVYHDRFGMDFVCIGKSAKGKIEICLGHIPATRRMPAVQTRNKRKFRMASLMVRFEYHSRNKDEYIGRC